MAVAPTEIRTLARSYTKAAINKKSLMISMLSICLRNRWMATRSLS